MEQGAAEVRGVPPDWVDRLLAGRVPGRAVQQVLVTVGALPREMSYASTSEAGRLCDVNVATVVRAAQLLGFSGWPGLRAEVRARYLARLSPAEVLDEHPSGADSAVWSTVRQVLGNLHEMASSIDDEQVHRVAARIAVSRTTLVIGSGSYAAPGLHLSHLAQTIGHDVRLQQVGGTSLINAVDLLGPEDLMIAFVLWRSPDEIFRAVAEAARVGAGVVVVCDQRFEDVRSHADELIVVPCESASMFPSLTATTLLVEAVAAELVRLDEESARRASARRMDTWRRSGLFDAAPG